MTKATGLTASVGPIKAESMIAVLATEAERYVRIESLQFERKRYRLRVDGRRRIRLLAPRSLLDAAGRHFDLEFDDYALSVSGRKRFEYRPKLGIAIGEFTVTGLHESASASLVARLGEHRAQTKVAVVPPVGAGITIKLEDVHHGPMRYRWNKNVLEIAARHESLKRYLGKKSEQFPGQADRHFRVLLAEIVAEASCSRRLSRNIESSPADFQDAGWDQYYDHYCELMSHFLPKAHRLMVPDSP